MRSWGPFTIERVPNPGKLKVLGVSLGAILAGLVVMAFIFWGYGVDPFHAYRTIFQGTLGSKFGLGEIVRRAIPLMLCGVGLVLAFRALFWNIGAEGQLLIGAVVGAGLALYSGIKGPWLPAAMFVGGFIGGAIWAAIPALLRVFLGVNDVLTTLMLNYVATYLVQYLIHGPWRGPTMRGFAYTDMFPDNAWLPRIGASVHWPTLVIGIALALVFWVFLSRTRFGYEVRVVGQSPEAARYAGISILKTILLVAALSGGAAGLAGVGEVAGIHHRLLDPFQVSMGYGYTAIIVAWLARGSPLVAIFTALFFGWIFASGDVIKTFLHMPFQVTSVFNGLLLFFLIGSEVLMYYRIRLRKGEG
jgi:simple sugar transport system permease protein